MRWTADGLSCVFSRLDTRSCCAVWLQGLQSNVETHGFTHHQKTAIVDRKGSDGRRHLVVFSGGLDMTQRMADSSDHPLDGWRGSVYPI